MLTHLASKPTSPARLLGGQKNLLWLSRLVIVVLILIFLSPVSLPGWVQYLPLATSVIFLGLPHGAVDHLVLPRLRREPATLKFLLYFSTAYLALAGLYTILWFMAPALAFLFFIVMTWFHWGQGDVYTVVTTVKETHLRTTWQRGLTLLVRGGLPMLLPLLAFPDVYREVAYLLLQIFGPVEATSLTWAFTPHFRWISGGCFLIITLLTLGSGSYLARTAQQRAAWRTDCLETVALAFYFSVVPPILAIGLYFCLWHSVRHIIRLLLIAPATEKASSRIDLWPAIHAFVREATPLTVAAILLLVILSLIVPRTPADLPDLVALYLVLISALTFPHTLTVCWMDWRQGIWDRSSQKIGPPQRRL